MTFWDPDLPPPPLQAKPSYPWPPTPEEDWQQEEERGRRSSRYLGCAILLGWLSALALAVAALVLESPR